MTDQFIGMKISLTSRAQLRYRGTVQSIDSTQGTMTLREVTSMGTEDRQVAQYIPPMLDRVHPVVVFTVNDILDLAIEPVVPTAQQTLPDDPAIRQNAFPQSTPTISQPAVNPPPPVQPRQPYGPPSGACDNAPPRGPAQQAPPRQPVQQAYPPRESRQPEAPPQQAPPAMSTLAKIEQTVGELRRNSAAQADAGPSHYRQGGHPGGRGPHPHHGPRPSAPIVPAEEYNFEQMNQRFEELRTQEKRPEPVTSEVVLSSSSKAIGTESDDDDSDDDEEVIIRKKPNGAEPAAIADDPSVYNKSKSFFDSVSSDVSAPRDQVPGGRGRGTGRGGGGGGGYRWQRSEERQSNLNTFGEAGGHAPNYAGGRGRGYNRGGGGGRGRGRAPYQQQPGIYNGQV